MERERVNEVLYEINDRDLGFEEHLAVEQLIELTSYNTFKRMLIKKKDLNKYIVGSKEYNEAVAFNKGMMSVMTIIASCFPKEEEREEAVIEREIENAHLAYLDAMRY